MKDFYKIYLVSDSTGETLDRIFLAIKAQFPNFLYNTAKIPQYKLNINEYVIKAKMIILVLEKSIKGSRQRC